MRTRPNGCDLPWVDHKPADSATLPYSSRLNVVFKACHDMTVSVTDSEHPDAEECACADTTKHVTPPTEKQDGPSLEAQGNKKPRAMLTTVNVEGLAASLIGVLHAGAWNVHFPTPLERWLWRISSIGVALFPIVGLIGVRICLRGAFAEWTCNLRKLSRSKSSPREMISQGFEAALKLTKQSKLLVSVGLGIVILNTCCFIFITVESYISLRDAPARSMIPLEWTVYWPHV